MVIGTTEKKKNRGSTRQGIWKLQRRLPSRGVRCRLTLDRCFFFKMCLTLDTDSEEGWNNLAKLQF
jgi:hypothetical protein